MAILEKELEQQLLEAGNKLLSPPSSVPELLSSLDQVENLLGGVEQSPTESMKEALAPATKALVADCLLRHSDVDVKVAVASCISEITRITAPDAPYEDEKMKEVFQLIVSSFEKLDDKSSRSYVKRASILETVAKVRSCVVMLDLECDNLIVEMFRHFFKSVRDDLHDNVLNSMETIMILVVEESEEISQDLLYSILNVLKKEDQEVLPIARQLGEKVIAKCASKLKPYILPAVRSGGASLDNYVKAVADVCQEGSEAVENTIGESANNNLADENELVDAPSEKAVEVEMETLKDAPPSEEVVPSSVRSPKASMSNGALQKEKEDTSAVNEKSKDAGHDTQGEEAEPNTVVESVSTAEPVKSQTKAGRSNRRKGRKPHSSKSSGLSETTVLDDKPEAVKTLDHHDNDGKNVDNIQNEEPVADAAVPAENEKAPEAPVSASKTSDNEPASEPSPTQGGSLAVENRSKKVRGKKADTIQDGELDNVDSKNASDKKKTTEKSSGAENKLNKRPSKKPSHAPEVEESEPGSDDVEEENDADEMDADSAEDMSEKTEAEGSRREVKKKQVQAKTTPGKGQTKIPAKPDKKKTVAPPKSSSKLASKDESDAEEALKSNSKRKRSEEEMTPKNKRYGAELVGATVKVWWPDDKKFYKGVVDSFDPNKKRHKVLYDDGDVEVLDFKNERWKLVGPAVPEPVSDGDSPDESADETPKSKNKKTNADLGTKHGNTMSSSKKSGASSSKSKAVFKSGKDDSAKSNMFKEESSSKSGADKGGKSKVSKSGSKLSDYSPKTAKKSKDNDSDTLKSSSKSKQDSSKGAGKSKGKSAKSVGKSTPDTSGKVKAGLSAMEDSEDESLEHEASPGKSSKGKSQSSSKSQTNSKKRKRSVKG